MYDAPTITADLDARPHLDLLVGTLGWTRGITFSPDGAFLATGALHHVILWDIATGTILRQWKGEWATDTCVFTPDGEAVYAGWPDATAYNARTGAWEGTLVNAGVPRAFVSQTSVLVCSDNDRFALVDCSSGHVLRKVPFGAPLDGDSLTVVSTDGTTGAAGGIPGARCDVRIFDLVTGRLRLVTTTGAWIYALALSGDGGLLVVKDDSDGLWICDTRTGQQTPLALRLREETACLAFSPDGKLLAAGTWEGMVVVWSVVSRERVFSAQAHTRGVQSVAFSADGRLLATSGGDEGLTTWRLDTGECHAKFLSLDFHATGIAYSPGGETIAAGYSEGTIRLWDSRTGAMKALLRGAGASAVGPVWLDDTTVATGLHPEDAAWDATTGELLRSPRDPQGLDRRCEALAPDGRILAVARGPKGWIEVRRRDTGELLRAFADTVEPDWIACLTFSADGKRLAVGYSEGWARIWDVQTGQLLRKLRTYGHPSTSLAFSPDGNLLAEGGSGYLVPVFNLQGERRVWSDGVEQNGVGEEATAFAGVSCEDPHEAFTLELEGIVLGLSFSPDGRTLATVDTQAMLKLWDATTGELRATLLPLPSEDLPSEEWIAHTPDGYYVSSPGAARFIRWREGRAVYPAETHAQEYERPDLVEQSLSP